MLSVSVWFLHLPADRLLYCLGHWLDLISTVCALRDAGTANSREASASSGSGQNPYGLLHTKSPKKGWQDVSRIFTVTHSFGACSTARESSICCFSWKLSVFTFGTEVTLHLWTAVKPERSQMWKTCTYGKELHVPPWNINSLVHLQKENTQLQLKKMPQTFCK